MISKLAVRTAPAWVAVVVALVPSARAGEPSPDAVLARIAEARRLVEKLDRLWPGFGREADRALRVRWARGVVVRSESDLPGERDAPTAGVVVLNRRARAGLWRRVRDLVGEDATAEAEIAWIVAGLFRSWIETRLPAEARDRPSVPALTPAEAGALVRSLESGEAEHARRGAREFLAARRQRLAVSPPALALAIERAEVRRGLALYTAYHALQVGRHAGHEPHPDLLEVRPGFRFEAAPAMRTAMIERLRRAAGGRTGAAPPAVTGFALGLLLDRTVHGWRETLLRRHGALGDLLLPSAP